MEYNNILPAKNRDEFRAWLSAHHASETECWVVCRRGRPADDGKIFWYIDAVEEALCFGWIDSTLKKIGGVATQRFCPRKKNSLWSELNKERVRRMERLGKMTAAGRAVLPDMTERGFVIDAEILAALKADEAAWRNFQSFPPLYRRVRIDTIQVNRPMRRPDLFKSRLEKFIENTRKDVMFGEWNDGGRLGGD